MTFARSEPVRLTRASLTGQSFRIAKVYGSSPAGIRVYIEYHAALGCHNPILTAALYRATVKGVPPMANMRGESCSWQYYARAAMTCRERERRECEGRKLRALELYELGERRAS